MRTFANSVVNFMKREDGPTAVEYAVMLALIIVVCITAITALGTNANKTFTSVSNTIGSTSSSETMCRGQDVRPSFAKGGRPAILAGSPQASVPHRPGAAFRIVKASQVLKEWGQDL